MRGVIVNGFVVGDLLGSGKTGLLYAAAHSATHQKAIVRVTSSNDGVETQLFVQEAAHLLATTGVASVEQTTLHDGRIVELVFVNEQPSARALRRRALIVLLPGALGVVLGASFIELRPTIEKAAPQAQVLEAPSPPVAPDVPLAITTPSVSAPFAAAPVASRVDTSRVRQPSRVSTNLAVAPPSCEFDDGVRRFAQRRLAQLRKYASEHSIDVSAPTFSAREDALGEALIARDCRKVNRALSDLNRFVGVSDD